MDFFKDIIHFRPKCQKQIAIYSRFYIFNRGNNGASQTEENEPNITQLSSEERQC